MKEHYKDRPGDYNYEFCSAMHRTITQHKSTFCSGSKWLSTLYTIGTLCSSPPLLRIRVFKVECTAKISISTPRYKCLYARIDRRGANGVSKNPMKRRAKNHHVLLIYRQCERFVQGFNLLFQEAFQIENLLFIVIS